MNKRAISNKYDLLRKGKAPKEGTRLPKLTGKKSPRLSGDKKSPVRVCTSTVRYGTVLYRDCQVYCIKRIKKKMLLVCPRTRS